MTTREELFSVIYNEYRHKIYRISYAYIYHKEEVEDLYQEIMVNIWNSLGSFRGESQIGTWVYRVAVNSAIFYNRKFKNYNKVLERAYEEIRHEVEIPIEEQETPDAAADRLARAVSTLARQDRLIISLLLEGLSYEEIAAVVGITPNYTGVKINRIKKQLKEVLKLAEVI